MLNELALVAAVLGLSVLVFYVSHLVRAVQAAHRSMRMLSFSAESHLTEVKDKVAEAGSLLTVVGCVVVAFGGAFGVSQWIASNKSARRDREQRAQMSDMHDKLHALVRGAAASDVSPVTQIAIPPTTTFARHSIAAVVPPAQTHHLHRRNRICPDTSPSASIISQRVMEILIRFVETWMRHYHENAAAAAAVPVSLAPAPTATSKPAGQTSPLPVAAVVPEPTSPTTHATNEAATGPYTIKEPTSAVEYPAPFPAPVTAPPAPGHTKVSINDLMAVLPEKYKSSAQILQSLMGNNTSSVTLPSHLADMLPMLSTMLASSKTKAAGGDGGGVDDDDADAAAAAMVAAAMSGGLAMPTASEPASEE